MHGARNIKQDFYTFST